MAAGSVAWSDAHAQPVTLEGRVADPFGEAIEGARVEMLFADLTTNTNAEGLFVLPDVPGVADDTLRVSHPDYRALTVPMDLTADGAWRLDVELQPVPVFTAGSVDQAAIRRRAEALLGETGGKLWRAEEFSSYLRFVNHPLELLLFSGLVEELNVAESGSGSCIVLRRPLPCASLSVVHDAQRSSSLRDWWPGEVDSFLVTEPTAEQASGAVTVFLWSSR